MTSSCLRLRAKTRALRAVLISRTARPLWQAPRMPDIPVSPNLIAPGQGRGWHSIHDLAMARHDRIALGVINTSVGLATGSGALGVGRAVVPGIARAVAPHATRLVQHGSHLAQRAYIGTMSSAVEGGGSILTGYGWLTFGAGAYNGFNGGVNGPPSIDSPWTIPYELGEMSGATAAWTVDRLLPRR